MNSTLVRNFGKGFFYGLIIIVFVAVGFISVLMISSPSCDEGSEAVTYARSLSKDRLNKLYLDMEWISAREGIPVDGYYVKRDAPILPREFSDLKVQKIRPDRGDIMVEGCFDHYVVMTFDGIGHLKSLAKHRQIVLSWGEGPYSGSEVIWSE